MSAKCFIKSSSILIWNSFSDKFTFLKGCQRAEFTAWRLKKMEKKLKFPAFFFFKRDDEEVRGIVGEGGRRDFILVTCLESSFWRRSLYKTLCSLVPQTIYWCWRLPLVEPGLYFFFQCRRHLSMGKSFFIRFSQFETASASHYPREELC